jgi:hypothetical protein
VFITNPLQRSHAAEDARFALSKGAPSISHSKQQKILAKAVEDILELLMQLLASNL